MQFHTIVIKLNNCLFPISRDVQKFRGIFRRPKRHRSMSPNMPRLQLPFYHRCHLRLSCRPSRQEIPPSFQLFRAWHFLSPAHTESSKPEEGSSSRSCPRLLVRVGLGLGLGVELGLGLGLRLGLGLELGLGIGFGLGLGLGLGLWLGLG